MSEAKVYKSKSRKPSGRINRAIKELKDAGRFEIGCAIFEQIIDHGVQEVELILKEMDRSKNYIITPELFEEVIVILRKHLEVQ
jgi:hypothetical protein